FTFGILVSKMTHYNAAINVASSVLHVSLNFFLVRSYGIAGAAGASVVALLVNSVATYVVGQRLYPIPFAIGRKLRVLLIGAVLCAVGYAIHLPTLLASVGIKALLVVAYFVL